MILKLFGKSTVDPSDFRDLAEKIPNEIEKFIHTEKFIRAEIRIEKRDPLNWFGDQDIHSKFYLRNREAPYTEISGLGSLITFKGTNGESRAEIFNKIEEMLSLLPNETRFYGGISFYENIRERKWSGFGTMHFFVPEVELITNEDQSRLVFNIESGKYDRKKFKELICSLNLRKSVLKNDIGKVEAEESIPSHEEWNEMVKGYLTKIIDKDVEKLVAARCVRQKFSKRIDPVLVLDNLRKNSEKCSLFMYVFNGKTYFVGSTPEMLMKRENGNLYTEAVAGTRPVSANMKETEKFGKELLGSGKDQREQDAVKQNIVRNLSGLCYDIRISKKKTLILSTLQHICTEIECKLRDGVSDGKLVMSLMPTPAVAGEPVEEAMEILRGSESFDRGWYSGTVGYIGKESSVLYVAIRSALVESDELSLYAGAGIVEGSVPEKEWDETEIKMTKFRRITGNGN